jgi:hypothetical protein
LQDRPFSAKRDGHIAHASRYHYPRREGPGVENPSLFTAWLEENFKNKYFFFLSDDERFFLLLTLLTSFLGRYCSRFNKAYIILDVC